jgi:LysM repeat protein
VQSGDTLSFLASSRGITLEELMAVNCLTDARWIIVGQTLFLPPGAPIVEQPSGNNSNNNSGVGNNVNPGGNDDDDDGDDDDD